MGAVPGEAAHSDVLHPILLQVEGLMDDIDFKARVSRVDFEAMCADLFERVSRPVQDALATAEMTAVSSEAPPSLSLSLHPAIANSDSSHTHHSNVCPLPFISCLTWNNRCIAKSRMLLLQA